MTRLKRALGMVDKDGNVFGMEEIRRQVMSSLGVSAPSVETVDIPGPPFAAFGECYEACLALPAPTDADFEGLPPETRALAVLAVFAEALTEGVGAYLRDAEDAYADRTAEALRTVGLTEQAEAFEADLAAWRADGAEPAACRNADWSGLRQTVLDYANGHPGAFCPQGTEET